MEGYDVVTSDEKKAGTVVGEIGDNLIVEHGMLRKTRTALPRTFAEVHDSERVVRATVSKEIFDGAPAVHDDELDQQAVAAHYGLAEGFADPESEGYGDTLPDDPGRSAEAQEQRTGVESAAQERAEVRSELASGSGDFSHVRGRPVIPPDEPDRSD